jgi:hypothetical protein
VSATTLSDRGSCPGNGKVQLACPSTQIAAGLFRLLAGSVTKIAPLPLTFSDSETVGAGREVDDVLENVAVTVSGPDITTVHDCWPLHAPDQPANVVPTDAKPAVRVTVVPAGNDAPHVGTRTLQPTPRGLEVTVPLPARFTVSGYVDCANAGPAHASANHRLMPDDAHQTARTTTSTIPIRLPALPATIVE